MASTYLCCLCCTACNSYKRMQNFSGESTEFYNITVKYFDPMLIADGGGDENSATGNVLCKECWSHIDDFNEFQKAVLKSRSLLQAFGVKETILGVKDEEEQLIEIFDIDTSTENDVIGSESCDIYNAFCYDSADIDGTTKDSDSLPENKGPAPYNIKSTVKENKKDPNSTAANEPKKKYEALKNTPEKMNKKKKQDKPSDGKDVPRSVYTLEKGREIDFFIAQWKPNLECDLCPITALNFDSLRSHFRKEHKTRFYIKCCDRKFYRRCILVDHIRLHVNPETHKCDICGKSSTSKYNLKLHKRIVHNDVRDFECEICHKNFNHKPTLDRHLLTHATGDKEFFCKDCGKGYVKEVQLNTHIRNVHNGVRICDQCGKTFYNAGSLKKHLIEHGVIPQPKFPCELCGVELKSNEALKRHKAAYHHDGSTVYICSVCGKAAASEHALLSHKKFVHEDNRKHKCTFCNKAFRTATVLREHIATHTGEDLYQCPHCPQTFKTNANMHHHRKRVHPTEWAEARKNRKHLPKVNIDQLRRQVII